MQNKKEMTKEDIKKENTIKALMLISEILKDLEECENNAE